MHLFQYSLRDQASNWLERLPAGSITTWEDLTTRFLDQLFLTGRTAKLHNDILIHKTTIDESAGCKLRDLNAKNPSALLEDLASMTTKVGTTKGFCLSIRQVNHFSYKMILAYTDCRLIEIKNQVQCLMEAHLAPTQPTQVNKITTSCEIYSGPHDT
ncbi:MAK10-like protein [Tanacetum coccineum]